MPETTYSVGDKVTLAASAGGWTGYIVHAAGGFYSIQNTSPDDQENGGITVQAAQIAAGPLSNPTFTVGDSVNLYGRGGEVTAVSGREITVELSIERCHYTITRTHVVQDWQLALWNPS